MRSTVEKEKRRGRSQNVDKGYHRRSRKTWTAVIWKGSGRTPLREQSCQWQPQPPSPQVRTPETTFSWRSTQGESHCTTRMETNVEWAEWGAITNSEVEMRGWGNKKGQGRANSGDRGAVGGLGDVQYWLNIFFLTEDRLRTEAQKQQWRDRGFFFPYDLINLSQKNLQFSGWKQTQKLLRTQQLLGQWSINTAVCGHRHITFFYFLQNPHRTIPLQYMLTCLKC